MPGSVLVTGASGYLGRLVAAELAGRVERLVLADVRAGPVGLPGTTIHEVLDVRSPRLAEVLRTNRVETVVHLASIVTPGPGMDREFARSVDVDGTRNVLEACLASGVRKLVVTSSGAAYGYHADNPAPLEEDHALRGNEAFAYAHHKRLVEEMLARWREVRPELLQLVFRPGTILGRSTRNQITALFERRVIVGVLGASSPFVFVWDEDAARCIARGALDDEATGVYNLAADGTMTLREIARALKKPYLPLPAFVLAGAIRALRAIGATRHEPAQVDFLRYRPVLSNDRLKRRFGYVPSRTTREAFDVYLEGRDA